MRLRWGPPRRSPRLLLLAVGGGTDHISTLPDDLLLLVLTRLECAAAATRTGVLSRRWRGLGARLSRIVLRDVPFLSLDSALARVHRSPPTVSLLEISPPSPRPRGRVPEADAARVSSLLCAAALLDPEEFSLVFHSGLVHDSLILDLPCFHRTTSIVLNLNSPCFQNGSTVLLRVPAGLEFPALETLSLSRCTTDFDALLSCCPRLRRLRLDVVWFYQGVLRVNSPLLQELVVDYAASISHVNIVTPMLTQLTISIDTNQEVNISVLAPMMEKLSCKCYFYTELIAFGLWRLQQLILKTAERQGQLPSLHIHAFIGSSHGEVANFTQQIEKQLIAAFSVLELNVRTKGHVYGAFVCHVLEINRIRCAIQRLKVDLQRPAPWMEDGCPPDCPCDTTDWRSQTISLTALEEVEICGFDGNAHDFDLLKLILRSAPMLKRMTMKLSQEASASNDGCTNVCNIFKAYSAVQCYVYLSSGLMHGSDNCPLT